jgi:hypothetical protein
MKRCSSSSRSPAASRATSRRDAGLDPRGRRARLFAEPRLRRASTTPTSSSPASSATARPRPGRWPRRGTRTSSSTRCATARCCRSCTSTATRSPTRRCWRASPRGARAAAARLRLRAALRRGRRPARCTEAMAAALDACLDEIRDPARRARRTGFTAAPALADDRAALAQGLDRPEGGRRQTRSRAPWRSHQVPLGDPRHPRAPAVLEEWLRSYRPEELFDADGRLRARARRAGPRAASGAWAPTRTPTAACCCATCGCPTSAYAVEVPRPGRAAASRPRACRAASSAT